MTRRFWIIGGLAAIGATMSARPIRGVRYKVTRVRRAGTKKAPSTEEQSGPLVFDLTAEERWPIRALDPALYIGDAVIESYQYGNMENTILRFTCYDPGQLQEGAQVFVQYGQDTDSRTNLPEFRWADVVNQ